MLFPLYSFADEEEIGKIENIIGSAEIIVNNSRIELEKDTTIHSSDTIITKDKTFVKILFFDGADIILYENTQIKIKEYKFKIDAEKKNLKGVFEDIKGKIRFFVKPAKNTENDVKYKTNNAVMGIRGTGGVIVAQGSQKTQLLVTSGKVDFSNPAAPDKIVQVKENQWGEMRGEKPPAPPKPATPEIIKNLAIDIPEGFELTKSGEDDKENKKEEDKKLNNSNPTGPLPPVESPTGAADDDEEDSNKEDSNSDSDNNNSNKNEVDEIFRIGPTVSIGLYQYLSIGIEMRILKFLGLSVNIGGAPGKMNLKDFPNIGNKINNNNQPEINNIKASFFHVEARAVIYPFKGSFFIGSAFGMRKLDVQADTCIYVTVSSQSVCVPANGGIKINTTYATPQFGWLFVWDSGFSIGTELGAQIPLSMSSNNYYTNLNNSNQTAYSQAISSGNYQDFQNTLQTRLPDYFNHQVLPFWNILKIGWLF